MKYSVIIPAFNCEKTIAKTVESVLKSGLTDFELIIVNDGSKDNTEVVCDKLSQEHPEVICIHKANGGVSSARNRGIDEAKGEYVLFMDSDDSLDPDSLTPPCDIIATHKPDMLIFGLSFDFSANSKLYRRDEMVYPAEEFFGPEQWSNVFLDLFNYNSLSPVWNKFYKSEIIKKNNIRFDESVFLMEDFLFVLDCMAKTEKIYLYNKVIYRYEQPENDKRVYSRINRVNDINDYMRPFVKSISNLTHNLKEQYNVDFSQEKDTLFELYKMFISQKAYYADEKILKDLTETIRNGRFSDYKTDDILFNDLKNENYKAIIKRHKKIQLRHKIAVTVKKNALYQKLRGN